MKFSIVIPTCNRRDILLGFTLPALVEQDMDVADYEIIIVDDGSSDDTQTAVTEFARAHPHVRLIFIRQENRGPATARNLGIDVCTGDYVLFMGDDTFPAKRTFLSERFSKHISLSDHRIGLLGYTGWYPPVENGFMRWLDRCDIQFGYNQIAENEYVDFRYGYTSNLSFARLLVVESGERFSNRFSKAMGEDIEYCYRLSSRHNMRLLYLPDLALWHHHVYNISEYRRRCSNIAIGKAELLEINPSCYDLSCSRNPIKRMLKICIGCLVSQFPTKSVLGILILMPSFIGRICHFSMVEWDGYRLSNRAGIGIDSKQ